MESKMIAELRKGKEQGKNTHLQVMHPDLDLGVPVLCLVHCFFLLPSLGTLGSGGEPEPLPAYLP